VEIQKLATRLGLHESLIEREYQLLVSIEELRSVGLMKGEYPLILGGGHGVRAYLPNELQRFSIDLDFYTGSKDIQDILRDVGSIKGYRYAGYGVESGERYKRYDSAVTPAVKKCTVAFVKKYNQSFKLGEVAPEFYLTVSNTLAFNTFHTRKPKSFIGVEYVKGEVPVLQPAVIIAEKVRIIPHRKTKDLYKDIFDIYALFNLSDTEIRDSQIVTMLAATGLKVSRYQLLSRFKETSDPSNARNAIKLPTHSRMSYLKDWCGINSFVRDKVLDFSRAAGMLDA
jgi:predicted nucleotidyltransferase component of viral defense system